METPASTTGFLQRARATAFRMSSSSPFIWFHLLDATTGIPYKETKTDFVSLPPGSLVVEFRRAVHLKNSTILTGISASQLLVYKNNAAFNKRTVPNDPDGALLNLSWPLDGLGESSDALIVVVPSSRSSIPTTSESSPTGKEPNLKRKQRWIELNEIFERNTKKSKTNDSTPSSCVTWNQVNCVFKTTHYVQPRRNMDDTQLNFLEQYLSITTKCFGDIFTGGDVKRLYFIAPILICVCHLLDGDVNFVVEEDLVGNFVNANCHFEFMLRHGNKAVCIVEAKKDDMEQGMIQDLVGCEVAAEVEGLNVVYGIVTSYTQWIFLRSLDDKVEREECSLSITSNGPERESLKRIAEKIYGMFSS